MIDTTIRHENLRKAIAEIQADYEGASDEAYNRLFEEFRHSRLICAGEVQNDEVKFLTAELINGMEFAVLFTDMDELRKAFPDFEVEAHDFPFKRYLETLSKSNLDGIIVNIRSETFILPQDVLDDMNSEPALSYSCEDSYTSDELKGLKDSIDNSALEEFIQNPKNIGKYEELFDLMGKSTLLTLVVSNDDLSNHAENGIISMKETGPLGYLYMDRVGGRYATVFTSEEKMAKVQTPMNKYSKIVNFSQMVFYLLSDDMDGVTINPSSENIVLTRDVLLEFSPLLDETCNDSRLNGAIYHMFMLEKEVHV